MSSFDPTVLLEILEKVRDQNLCPNRIWQACSYIKDWPSRQSTLQEILGGMFPKDALRHENHSACSIDFCEFSSRNFTAVQQYHEPRTCEESDQTNENHKQKGACYPISNLFSDVKLVQAVQSNKLTAWSLDGSIILEYPRPFMAISHVWSDGTGAGPWPSKRVNGCVYAYFGRMARQFQCDGIWWDTLCVPQDRDARSKALSTMHRNYEYARVTLVHDRFLRNVPFGGADSACLAIVLSSWFSRGWTALELAKSRKVKVIFKDSIQDLDKQILDKAQEGNFAAKAIKNLRRNRFSDMEDLLATLGPRYTSWLKDRATIAGLLAGIQLPHTKTDTFQRDIYQRILKEIGGISHDHLFHNSVTMSKGFSWCATNLFHLPHATTQLRLKINDVGEVSGPWKFLSISQFDPKTCLWGKSHELIEAKLQYALEKESSRHLLLVKPTGEGHDIEETKKGILVKVLKNNSLEEPQFKCQFVGSLYFSSALSNNGSVAREITIGDTEGWEELNEHEDAWHIMEEENGSLEDLKERVEGRPVSEVAKPETDREWPDLHRAAWLGDTSMGKLPKDGRRTLLRQRDKLGRRAIHLAAERGHKVFIEMLLLDKKDNPNSHIRSSGPDNGQTPLHRAAWGGCLETVKLLLTNRSDANAVDRRGSTALHIAADMGFRDVVKCLCEQAPALVEIPGRHGLTPLHYAALSGYYDVTEMLITRTAAIEVKDSKFGWTPLHCAAENGQVSVIKLLLDKSARVNETDDKVGWTPLHFAAMNGHTAAAEKLIIEGADINKEDKNSFTPLIFAAINGHHAVVETLISHGATISNSTFDWSLDDVKSSEAVIEWLKMNGEKFKAKIGSARWGEIYLAAMDGYTKTIRLVVDGDTHVSKKRAGNGARLLEWAARWGRLGTVRLLLQIDTDKDIEHNDNTDDTDDTDEEGWTLPWEAATAGHAEHDDGLMPLWLAAAAGHDDVTRALFDEANTAARNALLFEAVAMKHEVAVGTLLRGGANVEVRNGLHCTPLMWAVWAGDECKGVVQTLLEAGADIEATRDEGMTPLMQAASCGDKSKGIVQILLDRGADIEATDKDGNTPLVSAIWRGDECKGIVQILLEAGADIEATRGRGLTPLMQAASSGDKSKGIVQILLEGGADIEATDKAGYTPLMWAVRNGDQSTDIATILLEAGADIEVTSKSGETAASIAEEKARAAAYDYPEPEREDWEASFGPLGGANRGGWYDENT